MQQDNFAQPHPTAPIHGVPTSVIDGGSDSVSLVLQGLERRSSESGQIKRVGFLTGQISVPDDFDQMGSGEVEKLFNGDL